MLVLAHRGATGHHPENSLPAFAEARRLGADGVELDVRRGADGALVVHHDAEIPGAGPVAGLAVRDLPPHVPLLGQALDACRGMLVNVEVKSDGGPALPRSVVALLAARGFADRVVVSSFDAACLDAVRAADPSVPVAWLLGWVADARAGLRQATRAGYQGIHPFYAAVDAELVAHAHAAGLAVRAWTVNDPGDLRAMATCGVDAVVTDRPAAALAVAKGP
jgi:glycerophosphoryl diester phosphodiesterase